MNETNNGANRSSNNGSCKTTDNVSFPICLFCECEICTWPQPSCKDFKDGVCVKCKHDQKCLELVEALAAEQSKVQSALTDDSEMLYVFLYFLFFFCYFVKFFSIFFVILLVYYFLLFCYLIMFCIIFLVCFID